MSFQLNYLDYFYDVVFSCTFPIFKFRHREVGYQSILQLIGRFHNLFLKIFTFLGLILMITESRTEFLNCVKKTQKKTPTTIYYEIMFCFLNMLCEFYQIATLQG